MSNKNSQKWYSWILWWKIDENKVNLQTEKYYELPFFQRARVIAAGCMLLSLAITILLYSLNSEEYASEYTWIDIALLMFFCLFVYYGIRWVIISAMVYVTLSLVLSISNGDAGIMAIVFWVAYMGALNLALRVENTRKKNSKTNKKKNISAYDELVELTKMRDEGMITEEEFILKKKKILEI